MLYQESAPCEALRPLVECYWRLETGTDPAHTQRILPDGALEIILHLSRPFTRLHGDGVCKAQPDCFVAGQSTEPFLVRTTPKASVLGIRLRPEAARCVLGVPATELTGRTTVLPDVMPKARALISQLDRDTGLQEIESWLIQTVADRRPPAALSNACRRLQTSHGNISMDALARQSGLAPRQMQRLFLEHVGLSPKMLARIHRFQSVFQALDRTEDADWAGTALACGYSDQSHLLRDFRQFAGEPPTRLLRAGSDLAEMFLRTRRVSDFSKTALVPEA
ncbi:MAG: AraC family transcriptional regulator [Acidobacteriales bacterium]|nr:AraC family transcriptional regulator [Terriglobales bacterium]